MLRKVIIETLSRVKACKVKNVNKKAFNTSYTSIVTHVHRNTNSFFSPSFNSFIVCLDSYGVRDYDVISSRAVFFWFEASLQLFFPLIWTSSDILACNWLPALSYIEYNLVFTRKANELIALMLCTMVINSLAHYLLKDFPMLLL